MASTIILKHRKSDGTAPSLPADGEVVLNQFTGRLYFQNGASALDYFISSAADFRAKLGLTTKGDLLADNGSAMVRLAIGVTNGHVLTVDSAEATGMKWAAVSAGNVTDITAQIAFSADISPAQITANQNDYAPTGHATASTFRLNTDASRDLTGISSGSDGRVLFIHNVGSFDLVLKNESASSTAANRFALGADVTLVANKGIILQYDSTSSRWRALGGAGGGSFTSPTTTKGDLIVRNSSADTRLAVGATNGHVLTVDSAEATGMKWAAPSGGANLTIGFAMQMAQGMFLS